MTKSKPFFKYCSRCGDKFTPSVQGKMCKKCKDKGLVLMHLERIKTSLGKLMNPPNSFISETRLPLEKSHLDRLKKIEKSIDEEIRLLREEMKIK